MTGKQVIDGQRGRGEGLRDRQTDGRRGCGWMVGRRNGNETCGPSSVDADWGILWIDTLCYACYACTSQ